MSQLYVDCMHVGRLDSGAGRGRAGERGEEAVGKTPWCGTTSLNCELVKHHPAYLGLCQQLIIKETKLQWMNVPERVVYILYVLLTDCTFACTSWFTALTGR